MNQEFKERWIAALRSGEYKQGRNTLYNSGKFCCLGVACELLVEDGILDKTYLRTNIFSYGPKGMSDDYFSSSVLPDAACDVLEIDAKGTFSGGHFTENQLTNLNDTGTSFEEIADIIETYF